MAKIFPKQKRPGQSPPPGRNARNGAEDRQDALPPHSEEAERAALGCVLFNLVSDQPTFAQQEQDALLAQLNPAMFYMQSHALIFRGMVTLRMEGHALNVITLSQWLKDQKQLGDAGGLEYVCALPDATPSMFAFPTYLATLKDKALRRWTLQREVRLRQLAFAEDLSVETLQAEFAEIHERSERIGGKKKAPLKIWRVNELLEYKAPLHLRLVGDNEICMGYEGLTLVAGPGSSGKSLAVASLAIAGAIGKGQWMGRTVHRQFKTLILQAENGSVRLKAEIEAMAKAHPKLNIHDNIFISEPPEGGLPFHNADFRTAVRHEVNQLKPDLIVLDPWSQVAAEDAAKEVVDKLGEIRSCFPSGEHCPGLLIVAHTKKPRPEDVRRGRGLAYLVSGSVALPNTARTVYVLLPWSDELEDDRIYWSCPKLNNGQMYAASVWHRRFGTFFEPDTQTDPKSWGEEKRQVEETRAVTREDVLEAYDNLNVLKKSDLAKRLEKACGVGYSTVMRAITPGRGGYLAEMFKVTKEGWLQLTKEGK